MTIIGVIFPLGPGLFGIRFLKRQNSKFCLLYSDVFNNCKSGIFHDRQIKALIVYRTKGNALKGKPCLDNIQENWIN